MNAFSVLGLEPSFSLDANSLSQRQRELSRALHPDRYVGRPAGERRAALGRAIEVNEAHRKLKDRLSRAEELLEFLGATRAEGEQAPASPELLMNMMEQREELRDAARAKDAARIESLSSALRSEEEQVVAALSADFELALSRRSMGQEVDADSIHQSLGALRYYRRFFDEAEALLDELL